MRTNMRSTLVPGQAKWCPGRDFNPHSPCGEKDFKSAESLRELTNRKTFGSVSR